VNERTGRPSDGDLSDEYYDEFGFLHENAEEIGLEWSSPPTGEAM
jgi:hypothetical protein